MRGATFLVILLGLMALTLAILLFLPENGSVFGIEDEQFANLAYLSIIALAIASGLSLRSMRFSHIMRDVGIWLLFGLLLVTGYTLKDDLKPLWQRVTASLIPGQPISVSDNRVQIIRNSSGEFDVKALVNEASVDFLFDTGASSVVLTYDDAERAGFAPERLSFRVTVDTANGQTTAAPITIGKIQIGTITRRNIRGLVANKQDLNSSLLGMTFMSELTGFNVEGDTLELRN